MEIILNRGEIESIKTEISESLLKEKYVEIVTDQLKETIKIKYDELREEVKRLVQEEVRCQLNRIVKQEISRLVCAAAYEELVQRTKRENMVQSPEEQNNILNN